MKEEHLNEDQIIVSVVDEDDLQAGLKRHLKTCPLCQEERRILMSRLDEMGATARNLAPRPEAGPLRDPDPRHQDSKHRDPGHWQRVLFRRPVFASGLACFVIIAGIWGLMLLRGPQGKPQVPQVNEVASGTPGQEQVAETASTEDLSEESVLPESYLYIAGALSEDLGGGSQEEPQVSQVPQVNIAASESSGQEQVAETASTEDLSEESVLPEPYLDIVGASSEYLDDGFLEFVVPLEGSDGSA